MPRQGTWMFSLGYWLYVHTRLGRWLVERDLQKAAEQFQARGGYHVQPKSVILGPLTVRVVPYALDNYSYVISSEADGRCVVVDPGFAPAVQHAIDDSKTKLVAILITHKHIDHWAGLQNLLRASSSDSAQRPAVYATADDGPDGVTCFVHDEQRLELSPQLQITVLQTPGHTPGHVVYRLDSPAQQSDQQRPPLLFTGDTLFIGGCGRVLEGSFVQLQSSLSRLLTLDPRSVVFPGHEYTYRNLEFAHECLPENAAIERRFKLAASQRDDALSSAPSTIAEEKEQNPCLMLGMDELSAAIKRKYPDVNLGSGSGDSAVKATELELLRKWKDDFGYIQ